MYLRGSVTWHDRNRPKALAVEGFSLAIEYDRQEDGRWLAVGFVLTVVVIAAIYHREFRLQEKFALARRPLRINRPSSI